VTGRVLVDALHAANEVCTEQQWATSAPVFRNSGPITIRSTANDPGPPTPVVPITRRHHGRYQIPRYELP
jgi:hypothetical protein